MTDDKVLEVVATIDARLAKTGAKPKRHASVLLLGIPKRRALDHLRHVCEQIPVFIREGRREKAMRWLGFLQGAVWAFGWYTVEQLGEMNMPSDAAAEGQ